MKRRKKLIEVALPLDAINAASRREKSIRHGHPSTLHLWWARRPLAAARAVIFAQMVDDPSGNPDRFPTEDSRSRERARLFRLIEELVKWENTTNQDVLERARREILLSWRRTCADNSHHPRAAELFDPERLPAFHDPFAGGGALPLEAQRLGLEAYASDLNPVAVLINKAMIEIPPKFAGRAQANLAAHSREPTSHQSLIDREWRGAQGLAEDVRHYGGWMREEAQKRIGDLYPQVAVTSEMVRERPDLKPYAGRELTVIAWLWARTVPSPNPAFGDVEVPLASTFMLSTKKGKEAYVEPVIEDGGYRFTVKVGVPENAEEVKAGTKLARGANFRCLMSGTPMDGDYIKAEGKAGRMGQRLMAIVAEGDRARVYLAPTPEHEKTSRQAEPEWNPELTISGSSQYLGVKPYGLTKFGELFTSRQLVALTTFSDLVTEAREEIRHHALAAGVYDDGKKLRDGGAGATAYSEAVGMYLAFATSKTANRASTICTFQIAVQCPGHTFGRQAFPMSWDYAEANTLGGPSGSFRSMAENTVAGLLSNGAVRYPNGIASQVDAAVQTVSLTKVLSADPPYYDNVPYADLSDFFYVWLRRSIGPVFPELFTTLAVPRAEELVAAPYRHGSKEEAESYFIEGMTEALRQLSEQGHPGFPVTIYYAFKQSETKGDTGRVSTGWETFLGAVIRSGFTITGTWPVRTERENRKRNQGANALASSIVLVCRQRPSALPLTTRRDFVNALKTELPTALTHLQRGNIAPVDLAQAAIGPGMAIFTRYAEVLDTRGQPLPVRDALSLINQTLDEVLAEQEGDFDADTRWALAWFEQCGFEEGDYGLAETLSKAKNTSVDGLVEAGILISGSGKVRLLQPDELPDDWDPSTDPRLTTWETVHHLIQTLESGGESAAAELTGSLGSTAETARELCYRLYTLCERKKRASEALSYNSLVQSWPEITRLAQERNLQEGQGKLFGS